MVRFANPEAASAAVARINELILGDCSRLINTVLEQNADPDAALIRFENLLGAVSNPSSVVSHLLQVPPLAKLLFDSLALSGQIADILKQNPELSTLVLDANSLGMRPNCREVELEARSLVANTIDFAHAMDRLRFAKQRFQLQIAIADLGDVWSQREIWNALSETAIALVRVVRDRAWIKFAADRGIQLEECPVSLIAFGKLGGDELNYSSDIDLAYILRDEADEDLEREAFRFCEVIGRAITDRMGRGALYRVDLRLRPYGASGPILNRMKAVESYYQRYSEPWEKMALIRSVLIAGDSAIGRRWEEMRLQTVFGSAPSAWKIEEVVNQRSRIEEIGRSNDLKRGSGGIRDVEFLTQILQLLNGSKSENLQVRSTVSALENLQLFGVLDEIVARKLIDAYTLLRKIEHRCQIVDDLQTHTLPDDIEQRSKIACSLGFDTVDEFNRTVFILREEVRKIYSDFVEAILPALEEDPRRVVESRLGESFTAIVDRVDTPELMYDAIRDSHGGLDRLECLMSRGPILLNSISAEPSLLEAVITGEIEEDYDSDLPDSDDLQKLSKGILRQILTAQTKWCLEPTRDLGAELSKIYDRILRFLVGESKSLVLIALGSYGSESVTPQSDLDLLLLCQSESSHESSEKKAQELLSRVKELRRFGSPISVDLRLRPEGSKGLLVRSLEGFANYETTDMELWERFALGRSRIVLGDASVQKVLQDAVYFRDYRESDFLELLAMKRRIETERVPAQMRSRHLKLGTGGTDDADWLIQLLLLRSNRTNVREVSARFGERVHYLEKVGAFNAIEAAELQNAYHLLQRLRTSVALHGMEPDILPENPDRLKKLAHGLSFASDNELLEHHRNACEAIRGLIKENAERLTGVPFN